MPVTDSGKEILIRVPYIYYLVRFQEKKEYVKALLNIGNKVNIMSFAYIKKLGFKIWITNVKA